MENSTTPVVVNGDELHGVHESNAHADLPREPLSGIDVLIVGAGLGGLNAAVELYRQGHNVRLIEAKSQIEGLVGMFRPEPPEMLIKMY
jgi:NADPH-dependent 2,4-dienoyl-CoA reductase/sulfur reductase-like enzyme